MTKGVSIVTDQTVSHRTQPASTNPAVGWDVNRFETLIQTQGYKAYIDRAMRCPCADKNSGQALSTCKNCLGRGWIFTDRTETTLLAQRMDSKKRYLDWSEVNMGTASITTRGIDRLGFMDRIILTQLEEYYSEILRPIVFDNELIAYPVYEPLEISKMLLFVDDTEKLMPIDDSMYTVDKNLIRFSTDIISFIKVNNINIHDNPPVNISVRYNHYPVYHVIDLNRELMKVREGKPCGVNRDKLRSMPINALARKAHFIFDSQRWGESKFEN